VILVSFSETGLSKLNCSSVVKGGHTAAGSTGLPLGYWHLQPESAQACQVLPSQQDLQQG